MHLIKALGKGYEFRENVMLVCIYVIPLLNDRKILEVYL